MIYTHCFLESSVNSSLPLGASESDLLHTSCGNVCCQFSALSPSAFTHSLFPRTVQMESPLSKWLIDLLPLIVIRILFCPSISSPRLFSPFSLLSLCSVLSACTVRRVIDLLLRRLFLFSIFLGTFISGISILADGERQSSPFSASSLSSAVAEATSLNLASLCQALFCCTWLTAGLLAWASHFSQHFGTGDEVVVPLLVMNFDCYLAPLSQWVCVSIHLRLSPHHISPS